MDKGISENLNTTTVKLANGLLLGNKPQTEAVLRESTVGDMLAANEEAYDDAAAGALMIARQIVSIGEIQGPFDRTLLDKLSSRDMEQLEQADRELASRGREDGPGQKSGD